MSLEINWPETPEHKPTLSPEFAPLKQLMIDYVGDKLNPEDNEITVEMIVSVLAEEFPELTLSLAEENWVRGYEQGLQDLKTLGEE